MEALVAAPTTRDDVVEEARSWIGTPYVYRAMVKGSGVDCGLFPLAIYMHFVGSPIEFEHLPDSWWQHTTDERYLLIVERFIKKLMIVQARRAKLPGFDRGNVALTKACGSKVFNHGGIIADWPRIVHATPDGVREVDAMQDVYWVRNQIAVFDISILGVTC
jgi:cell wall-associated NlpC family hydrolase